MVVIEQDENQKPQTTSDSVHTTTTAPNLNGNDTDNYETASDRDVSDNEDDNKSNETTTELDTCSNDAESEQVNNLNLILIV